MMARNTVKPLLSGHPLSRVPKLTYIALYNEPPIQWTPLLSGHPLSRVPKLTYIALYNEPPIQWTPLLSGRGTKIPVSCIWLISIVKNLY